MKDQALRIFVIVFFVILVLNFLTWKRAPRVVDVHSYWTGPVDESLLLCWYNNHLNPSVHQIFHLDDPTGWYDAMKRYPFLREIETRPIDWQILLDEMAIPYSGNLLRELPSLKSNTRSNILRYSLLFREEDVFYMDSDVCLFHLDGPGFDLRRDEFVVREYVERAGKERLANAGFHFHSHLAPLRTRFAPLFLDRGSLGKLRSGKDSWGIVGPALWTEMIDPFPQCKYPEEPIVADTVISLSTEHGWGWNWDDETLKFCDVWADQISQGGMGIHLWRDRREQYRGSILKLTQIAFQTGRIPVHCPFTY